MAKRRPSVHKREREMEKRQRELRKSQKAADKRKRRLNREQDASLVPREDADTATERDVVERPDNPV